MAKHKQKGVGISRAIITNSPDSELVQRLSQIKSNLPVSIAFGKRFEYARPSGLVLNPDTAITLTQRPADLFKAIGSDLVLPHRTVTEVQSFYGALRNLLNLSDGQPLQYLHRGGTTEIADITDFCKISDADEGFDPSGVFTPGSSQVMHMAVAPALFKYGREKSITPLNGLSINAIDDKVFELIQKATAKLQLDYLVLTLRATSATGARIADVKTHLVEPALKMVDEMIAERIKGK